MTVRETVLPSNSVLSASVAPGDFVDCYEIESNLDAEVIALLATHFPAWVGGLMFLRNLLVIPFGLRIRLPPGERIGMFPVAGRGDNEILMGFDDRHLDFRIAVLRRQNLAYAATWVRPHNFFGRAYLRLVLPFHRLIMRNAMARVLKN